MTTQRRPGQRSGTCLYTLQYEGRCLPHTLESFITTRNHVASCLAGPTQGPVLGQPQLKVTRALSYQKPIAGYPDERGE